MTKRELIRELAPVDDDAMIYVPTNRDGKNGTAVFIAKFDHTNLEQMPGIRIAPDIALLPGNMEQFVVDSDDLDERMGNLIADTPYTWRMRLADCLLRLQRRLR